MVKLTQHTFDISIAAGINIDCIINMSRVQSREGRSNIMGLNINKRDLNVKHSSNVNFIMIIVTVAAIISD